ncbi:MAG: 2-oxo acid dehydrogenase subunit E2 [Myxococcota bacterium]
MPYIAYSGPARESSFRRMAMAAWDKPGDPTIYGYMDIDARAGQRRIDALRAEGFRVTWTHLVARAVGLAFAQHPDANVTPRLTRSWRREDVDVFLQVALPTEEGLGATDLSGVKIRQADRKPLPELAREVTERVEKARARQDAEIETSKRHIDRIPRFVLKPVLRFLVWLQVVFNLDLRWLGLPRDPFGSAMVTSMGMMGIDTGFAPLFPPGPPVVLLLGSVQERPVVEDGEVVARPVLRIGGTFDHRCFDGYHLARLGAEMKRLLEEGVDAL